jgi:DNA repair protein RecN (Recombination protein N)
VLRALSETLVELHGQHDDRGLLNPRGHRRCWTPSPGSRPELAAVRAAWRRWRAAAPPALARRRRALEGIARRRISCAMRWPNWTRWTPSRARRPRSTPRRRLMQAAERIRADIARAATGAGPEGAEGCVPMRCAGSRGGGPGWRAAGRAARGAGRALTALGEASRGGGCLEALEFDPRELEAVRGAAVRDPGAGAQAWVRARRPAGLSPTALRARLAALDAGEDGSRR